MGRTILSGKIAQFMFEVNYQELPLEVIDKAKQCLMDTLGVAILGSRYSASRIVGDVVDHCHGREESVVIGTYYKAPAFLAALANSVSAHVADYDDMSVEFNGHPSCVIVPAVTAAGESVGAGGQEVLLGIVVGNEVGSKLGKSLGGKHYQKGWHGTGTIGTVAAAAAVAKLLKLDSNQIVNALGIAASSAAGLRQNFGTMTKSWHAGHAASNGILAAVLAQNGFEASAGALEGNSGFITTFDGEGTVKYFDNLGNPYSLPNVTFKKYPSCASTHPAVEAIFRLMNTHATPPDSVATVECYVCPAATAPLRSEYPSTELEAKFSLEYCVATALVRGRLGVAEFEDEAVRDPEIRHVMTKVRVIIDAALEEIAESNKVLAPTRVKLTTKDGQEFSETIIAARGGPTEPLTWPELEDKFRECASSLFSVSRVTEALGLIREIENMKNINELTALLQP